MLVTASGQAHGYVSGGCVEAAVAEQALACLHDGMPRLLHYGQGSPYIDIQLTCGGSIHVLVRRVERPKWWVSTLREARSQRRPVRIATSLITGAMRILEGNRQSDDDEFDKQYSPPTKLVLVGSDPVTLATAIIAKAVGLQVVLWRPHGPPEPPEEISVDRYFSSALRDGMDVIDLDSYTALYCLTHDMDTDVDILLAALASPAFCVGVLGSRLKQSIRLQRLAEAGATESQLSRLRSPAGVAIGATNPQEIALSIVAEVIAHKAYPSRNSSGMGLATERAAA